MTESEHDRSRRDKAWVLILGLLASLVGVQVASAAPATTEPPAASCADGATARVVGLPSGGQTTLCYAAAGRGAAAGQPVAPPSLTLVKTVGTDPSTCASADHISVAANTEVFYCYSVVNEGAVTFTAHTLEDDKLGTLLDHVAYDLGPGDSRFVTASATIGADTVNLATWTASSTGGDAVATASATVTVADVPSAPVITAASAQEGEIHVAWNPPASDGGSPVTGYVVTPYIGSTPGTPVPVGAGEGTAVLTGLVNGTTYTVQVVAENTNGAGPAATSAAVTPQWWLPWSSGPVAVSEIFTWLTGVAPTSDELTEWLGQLDGGSALPGDLVEALRRGPDALDNVDPTVRLYAAYLTRIPDAGGLNFWLNRRRAGWTLYRISSNFAASSEFIRRYGKLSNLDFVKQVYRNVLGREGDASGISYWTKQLDTKRKSRGQVMINFSESNEYKTKQADNVDAAVLYIHLLGRAPTELERNAVVALLQGGKSVADVARSMIHQPSFDARAG